MENLKIPTSGKGADEVIIHENFQVLHNFLGPATKKRESKDSLNNGKECRINNEDHRQETSQRLSNMDGECSSNNESEFLFSTPRKQRISNRPKRTPSKFSPDGDNTLTPSQTGRSFVSYNLARVKKEKLNTLKASTSKLDSDDNSDNSGTYVSSHMKNLDDFSDESPRMRKRKRNYKNIIAESPSLNWDSDSLYLPSLSPKNKIKLCKGKALSLKTSFNGNDESPCP